MGDAIGVQWEIIILILSFLYLSSECVFRGKYLIPIMEIP